MQLEWWLSTITRHGVSRPSTVYQKLQHQCSTPKWHNGTSWCKLSGDFCCMAGAGEVVAIHHYREAERDRAPAIIGSGALLAACGADEAFKTRPCGFRSVPIFSHRHCWYHHASMHISKGSRQLFYVACHVPHMIYTAVMGV